MTRGRGRWPGATVVVLALLGAGCASEAESGAGATSTIAAPLASTTTLMTEPTCDAADLDPAALEPLMVRDVEGFTLQPDSVGDTGPSGFDKAVRDDGDPDAADVLIEAGFRRGYQRLWMNDARDTLVVFVYEFCTSEGARQHALRWRRLLAERAPVEDLPASSPLDGYVVDVGDVHAAWVWNVVGPTLVQAIAYVQTGTDVSVATDRATALVTLKSNALPT